MIDWNRHKELITLVISYAKDRRVHTRCRCNKNENYNYATLLHFNVIISISISLVYNRYIDRFVLVHGFKIKVSL